MDEDELKRWFDSKMKALLTVVEKQDCDAGIKIRVSSSKIVTVLIDTSMKEIKPAVSKKILLENRNVSNLLAFFWYFGLKWNAFNKS